MEVQNELNDFFFQLVWFSGYMSPQKWWPMAKYNGILILIRPYHAPLSMFKCHPCEACAEIDQMIMPFDMGSTING